MKYSRRTGHLKPEGAYQVLARAQELEANGHEIIHFEIGQRNLTFDPNQVVVSPGAKPNLFFPVLALVEPGDEVIYLNPGFPTYEAVIRVAGGIPMAVPLVEENCFSFNLEGFDSLINDRTRLIVLNSPSNPTGGVIPEADLGHIAAQAQKYNCSVLSDEIYCRIVYDELEAASIAAVPGMQERTIIVGGFSKTYAMTGCAWGMGITKYI